MSETSDKKNITIPELFEKVQKGISKYPEKVDEYQANFLFRISGKVDCIYYVNLSDNPGVTTEDKPADCEITVKDRDLLKIYKGILPGYKAALNGKLKVKGSILLAKKLGDLFNTD